MQITEGEASADRLQKRCQRLLKGSRAYRDSLAQLSDSQAIFILLFICILPRLYVLVLAKLATRASTTVKSVGPAAVTCTVVLDVSAAASGDCAAILSNHIITVQQQSNILTCLLL